LRFSAFVNRQNPKLHKVISAAAGAELVARFLEDLFRHLRDVPILVQNIMLKRLAKRRAGSEKRLAAKRVNQLIVQPLHLIGRDVEDRELHPAGDIDADGIRNDRILGSKDTTNWKAVTLMCVRHERA